VLNNPILIRRQLHNIANWSRFGATIPPNLDQFGHFRGVCGFHIRLRARTG